MNQNHSNQIHIINGKVTREQSFSFVYEFRVVANAPGEFDVGPFEFIQDGHRFSSDAIKLKASDVADDGNQHIRLVLPSGKIWINQPVEVAMEWWLSEELVDRVGGRQLTVPLFGARDQFRFEDVDDPDARISLDIETGKGTIKLEGNTRREQHRGETYLVVQVRRTIIPLRAGTIDISPSSALVEEIVRWQRNVFGERVPTDVHRIRARDKPRTLTVLAPPQKGRPASYTGVVGDGLSVDVMADRSVVQVGDPIALTVSVRGAAKIGGLSLPAPEALGLSPKNFRISREPIAGKVVDSTKQFRFDVRALHANVHEIPPLEISWFNAKTERFDTATSAPVALSVTGAQVVSASDVVRSDGGATEGSEQAREETTDVPAPSTRSGPVVLTEADLSIEADISRLERPRQNWHARPSLIWGLYGGGVASVFISGCVALRRRRDPAIAEANAALRSARTNIVQANTTGDLLDALRAVTRLGVTFSRDDHDALIQHCEGIVYGSEDDARRPLDAGLATRARAFAQDLGK
ncbi:MAG: hypothetical protein HOI95_17425 [Chromatiales bacterium]|nr:hypothetical protein [Chromatiales bacterium]